MKYFFIVNPASRSGRGKVPRGAGRVPGPDGSAVPALFFTDSGFFD